MVGIYKIVNPEGKIYIGQTKNYLKRVRSYSKANCKFQIKIYNSIIKYGWENHSINLIVECSVDSLDEREIFYINKYNSTDRDLGLNLKSGGSRGVMTSEGLEKMRNSHKKRFEDNPLLYNKMSEMGSNSALKTKGKPKSKHIVDKIITTKKLNGTLRMKQESIDKMKATIKQRFLSDPSFTERMKSNNKLSSGNKKKVRCILTDRKWNSCKEMCLEMGLNEKYTRKQLSGARTNFTSYEYM